MAAALSLPPPPAERLATLIEGLCRAVAAHGVRGLLTASLLLLLWSRLRRMAGRAQRLAARVAAGAPLSRPRGGGVRAPSPPYTRLPRGFAWLVRAVPGAASGASQLQHLLADPEMAVLAEAPAMRRLVRPLCRMLGVRPPPTAKPPPAAAAQDLHASDPPPAPSVVPSDVALPSAVLPSVGPPMPAAPAGPAKWPA